MEKNFLRTIKEEYEEYDSARTSIIKHATQAQKLAKKAIFSVHRSDLAEAEKLLKESELLFIRIHKEVISHIPRAVSEGSYRSALEEYVESMLFFHYIKNKKLLLLGEDYVIPVHYTDYLGALCDFTGELVRKSIISATIGEYDEINRFHALIELLTGEFLEFNLTGHLRSKFDQLKRNLKSIEQIQYDIALKKQKIL